MSDNHRVFWTADVKNDTPYMGGLYYRSEIKDFIKKVETDGDKEVVGIVVDDTYNLEFIYRQVEEKTNVVKVDFGMEEE